MMQRIYKFRAWDGNEMKFAKDGTRFFDSEACFPDEIIEITTINHGWTWMQYSGLSDFEGSELYESDVCEDAHGDRYIIEYQDGAFVVRHEGNILEYLSEVANDLSLIGNIYENPELLVNNGDQP